MFITFEGIEGCGKTTQTARLGKRLGEAGIPLITTLEPGATPIGKKIRAILLDPLNRGLNPFAELMLYEADRAQHVAAVIRPALKEGKWVLCDRFFDATTVYQGYARGLDLRLIETLNTTAAQGITPDLTFLLDCPAEVGIKRALGRNERTSGDPEDRFEREAMAFHQAVREGYLRLAQCHARIFVVDASQEEERMAAVIFERVAPFLQDRQKL